MQILQQNTNGQIIQIVPPTPPIPLGVIVGMGGAYSRNPRDGALANGNENRQKIMHERNELKVMNVGGNMLPVPPSVPYVPYHEEVNEVSRIKKDRDIDRERLKLLIRESEKTKIKEESCKEKLQRQKEDGEQRAREIERQARAMEYQAQQDRLAAYQYRQAVANKDRAERQRMDDQDAEVSRMRSEARRGENKDGRRLSGMVEAQKGQVTDSSRFILLSIWSTSFVFLGS